MSDNAVKLTNHRKIPMLLPDGQGNTVELQPGEEKVVFGDYQYFRRMPEQGIAGLSVKLEAGRVRLLEKAKRDVGLFKITNHRQIPMILATGVHEGRRNVEIGPGETVEVVARESIVKQMTGITVREVAPPAPPKKEEGKKKVAPPKTRVPPKTKEPEVERLPKNLHKTEEELAEEVRLTAEAESTPADTLEELAKAEAAIGAGETEGEKGPPPMDLAAKRAVLGLPATREEWGERAKRLTWHDLRGIAKELGVRGRGRASLTEAIGETYGDAG